MKKDEHQTNFASVEHWLKSWLLKYDTKEGLTWLENKKAQILATASNHSFLIIFSGISRYFGKELIPLTPLEMWRPRDCTMAQLARIYFLIGIARQWPDQFMGIVSKLFKAADLQELIALYKALPLFPHPDKFYLQATEGIRSNMVSVFEAIALNNPYPADYFTEPAWNQLVLKTLFVDSSMAEVIGIKRRANANLAQMLINTAKERAAADRPIKRELWYLMGISSDKTLLKEITQLVANKNPILQNGALLACTQCKLSEAKSILDSHANLRDHLADDLTQLQRFDQQLM